MTPNSSVLVRSTKENYISEETLAHVNGEAVITLFKKVVSHLNKALLPSNAYRKSSFSRRLIDGFLVIEHHEKRNKKNNIFNDADFEKKQREKNKPKQEQWNSGAWEKNLQSRYARPKTHAHAVIALTKHDADKLLSFVDQDSLLDVFHNEFLYPAAMLCFSGVKQICIQEINFSINTSVGLDHLNSLEDIQKHCEEGLIREISQIFSYDTDKLKNEFYRIRNPQNQLISVLISSQSTEIQRMKLFNEFSVEAKNKLQKGKRFELYIYESREELNDLKPKPITINKENYMKPTVQKIKEIIGSTNKKISSVYVSSGDENQKKEFDSFFSDAKKLLTAKKDFYLVLIEKPS